MVGTIINNERHGKHNVNMVYNFLFLVQEFIQ